MAEETEVEEHKEEPVEVDPLPPKHELDTMSRSEIDHLIRGLRDEVAKMHGAHAKEREELKGQIADLQDFKKNMEDAEHRREESDAQRNTMVLPPNDIPPQQPSPPPNPPELEESSGSKRRWKSLW